MHRISEKIYLGNSHDARTEYILAEGKITAILNCAHDLSQPDMGRVRINAGLIDGHGNDKAGMVAAMDHLGQLLKDGHTVLVHCHMGMSRSPTVVAAFIARHDNHPFDVVMDYIKGIRDIVMPHHALTDMAKDILGEVTKTC